MAELSIWTVYDHPADYPKAYVARRFVVGPGGLIEATSEVIVSPTLAQLRAVLMAKELVVLARSPGDEPQIVESWI